MISYRKVVVKYCAVSAFALAVLASAGCVSTSINDFTDPDYISFTAHNLFIDAPNTLFDRYLNARLKGVDVAHLSASTMFLPTREYTAKQKAQIIKESGADSYLFIQIGDDRQSSAVAFYLTNTTANAYSTGYGSGYAQGFSTTIPITASKRRTGAKAILYDVKTGQKIWVADLDTSAKGSHYMSDKHTVNSIVKTIVKSLLRQGHLLKR